MEKRISNIYSRIDMCVKLTGQEFRSSKFNIRKSWRQNSDISLKGNGLSLQHTNIRQRAPFLLYWVKRDLKVTGKILVGTSDNYC
jgi:hypothetical protein